MCFLLVEVLKKLFIIIIYNIYYYNSSDFDYTKTDMDNMEVLFEADIIPTNSETTQLDQGKLCLS